MRIIIVAIALLLAGTAYAEEFKPPDIYIRGTPARPLSKDDVEIRFKAAQTECIARAVSLLPLNDEPVAQYEYRRRRLYHFCYVEEFAADGLLVYLDAPRSVRSN